MNVGAALDPFGASWFRRRSLEPKLQSESAECGIACLAMVSAYHGHEVSMSELRNRFGSSARGMSLATMITLASSMGLSSRPVRVPLESLPKMRVPAILHWDLDHFVVLERTTKGRVVIVDPSVGRITMKMGECSKHFTGVALEVHPSPTFSARKSEPSVRLSTFLRGTSGLARALALIFVVSLAIQALALMAPLLTQLVLDHAISSADTSLIVVLALAFAAIAITQVLTGFARTLSILHLGAHLKYLWGSRLFRHLVRLPLSYFERRHVGDVMSRFNSIETIQSLVTTTVVEAILDGILAVTTLAVMLAYSVKLTVISIIALSLILVMRVVVLPMHRSTALKAIQSSAKEDSHLLETLRAMLTIKSFGIEHLRETGWQTRAADEIRTGIATNLFPTTERSIAQLVLSLESIAVVALGAVVVIRGGMTVGMLVAFIAYKTQFTGRASGLIDKLIDFRLASVHLDRLADILDERQEIGDGKPVEPAPLKVRGAIRGNRLAFQYSQSDPPVFEDLDLDIPQGSCVVIVGPSGSGKTTLLKALMGLLRPTSGQVEVDDTELSESILQSYRQQIASVMQEDTLLNGSLVENITLFEPSPDLDLVARSISQAQLDGVISALPMGLSTAVGDMGSTLSGGQRQRVLMARALYRQPRILFLDEATSHLDVATEKAIHETLGRMGMTRVVISHRPDTVRIADKVIDMSMLSRSSSRRKSATNDESDAQNRVHA